MLFREWIKKKMQEKGLKRDDVADHLGIATTSLQRKLKGGSDFTEWEAQALRELVGAAAVEDVAVIEDPALQFLTQIVASTPELERWEYYMMGMILAKGKMGRMKPAGEEALSGLRAYVRAKGAGGDFR